MATVLCTGVHPGLIQTRKLILEREGHVVVAATTSPEIVTACHSLEFDVAVIGQSAQPALKREWAALIRTHCPKTKILEIYIPNYGPPTLAGADAWLESPAIPAKLAQRVAILSGEGEAA